MGVIQFFPQLPLTAVAVGVEEVQLARQTDKTVGLVEEVALVSQVGLEEQETHQAHPHRKEIMAGQGSPANLI
jgi:hypothetical protein